ncbi:cytochrome P450 [Trujillonella endophytica]|uniref:Pulcherriminic acid synthase n=1 Tax=Trujillonella endophytica TaxID=673521 RepID=A0A1H8QID2_9ACTN|nr:cytochrome P450 [Trujillella endophytica]SEO53751.1 pulcherriminic acid synthase [Trujillella endophytica]
MSQSTIAPQAPDILSPEYIADPYPSHKILRDHYPAVHHEATQSWLISRYADVADAFRNPAFSSKNYDWQLEPVHGRTILQMEGKEHATHRQLLNPFFRGKGLEAFLPIITQNAAELVQQAVRRAADDLVENFSGRGRVDLVAEFTTWFPINVMVDMLGLPKSDHERFHRWYHAVIAHLNNLAGDPAITAAADQTREELREYMLPIIRERRTGDGDDLLSRLCRAEVDGEQMSDEEIKAFVSLLLVAGGETTDKAIASMVRNLLDNPEQLEAVRADRGLTDAVIAETLRYTGPVHMIMRQTEEPVEIEGTTIPTGQTCILMLASANRDERHFANPDTFDIHRPDLDVSRAFSGGANHVQFILGRHFCVGSLLAREEMTVALNLVLDRLPNLRYQEGFTPKEVGLYTRSVESLLVEFDVPAAS